MAKKERLGSDPFKESPLNWIQDTREEKKEHKEEIKKQKPQNVKASKRLDVKTLKRQSVKAPKSLNVKTSIKDKVKKTERKKRHTIYLSLIHISEPTRLGMISYAVFCLKKKKKKKHKNKNDQTK